MYLINTVKHVVSWRLSLFRREGPWISGKAPAISDLLCCRC